MEFKLLSQLGVLNSAWLVAVFSVSCAARAPQISAAAAPASSSTPLARASNASAEQALGSNDRAAPAALADEGEGRVVAAPATTGTAAVGAEAVPATNVPEVPVGTTVLHVGDSFAGALGIELNKLFDAAGIKGVLRYKTATYIPTWANDKDLSGYLRQYQPDLVLVTLGANELKIPDPEVRAATIHRLVARFGDRPCVWIAPPLWAEGQPLLDVIRRECAPCVYMDTNQLITHMDRARDKIHPSTEARGEWARVVYDWLLRHRARSVERVWRITPDGV